MNRLLPLLVCLLLLPNAKANTESGWSKTLQRVANSVVSIRVDAARSFDTAASSSSQATGFVVDAERGLILTNRHVVQSGPVVAEALFSNREEVELKPLYRDPVHDFGFFQYDPEKLQFLKPVSLQLKPEKARVGVDIRIVGNDAGEQLSILAGTLARLDRSAPYYGSARYNDFNTFYYQSASGVSGGSSGSPVIDIDGDVFALNAGGSRKAASSFFLPLQSVVRALKLIQQNRPVTRGTLQTTLVYEPYDEVRRLGLRAEVEAQLRQVNNGTGLLVVQRTLPEGPADGILQPGDIVLKGWAKNQSPQWLRQFDEFEALLDSNVGKPIHLLVERNSKTVQLKLTVADLHAITPDRYIEFGGALVHQLSYQQARHLNRPLAGVYVAESGFVFSTAGIPVGAVILKVDNKPVRTLDDFEKILNQLADDQQVTVHFITFKESKRTHVSIMNMDREWFSLQKCYRDDVTGTWPCVDLPKGPAPEKPKSSQVRFVKYKDARANRLSSSIIHVQFDLPFKADGVQETHYGGAGLIVDAENGLVVVDRNTVPIPMGDVRMIFAGAVDIPGQVLFVHPLHNFAILKYDPSLLGDSKTTSAKLLNKKLETGDKVWLVGIRTDHSLLSEPMTIASIDPLEFSIPKIPAFRESNLDVISLNNAPYTRGGVLADEQGNVVSLWASFSYGSGSEFKQFEWGMPIDIIQQQLAQWHCCKSFDIKSLEVELATLTIAQARKLGLPDQWLKKFQQDDQKRQVIAISRLVAGTDAAEKLQEGDLLLAIDGTLVRTFRDVEKLSNKDRLKLTIVRAAKEILLEVETKKLNGRGTERVVQWAGALIQNPYRALAYQRGIKPEGVHVSHVWSGSPANRYGLGVTHRIIEVNGHAITDLDDFIKYVTAVRNNDFVQLKVHDLIERESVITLKQNNRYWPIREVARNNGEWLSRGL
ncbi:MAG: trypsin-like peptidase domain-containing protein [Gammaproteobacteria bacterium]|nr:trypsin-like peptidase domain-containing protein [Gammaproteobacteria bacterium]